MADVLKGVGGTDAVAPSTSSIDPNKSSSSSIKITPKTKQRNGNNGGVKPSTSNGGAIIANEFKAKLDGLLDAKPSISKEKMNQIVQEAIRSAKHYKHVVYYVESFIKKVRIIISNRC